MKTFNQINKPSKKFVGLFFDQQTNQQLIDWSTKQGFDLQSNYSGEPIDPQDFDFHLTIFFTTSEHTSECGEYFIEPLQLVPTSMGILGSDKQIPVINILLDAKLENIRFHYENIGFQDAWPDYKPHVSVSYKYSGTPDITEVRLPDFPLIATRVKIENQDQ